MPSTVCGLLDPLGLAPGAPVPWGSPVRETSPGVYLVSLTKDRAMQKTAVGSRQRVSLES